MRARTLHKIIGLTLLLPFFAWAITGFVFFLKPGYAGAYEMLSARTYPLNSDVLVHPDPSWREVRYFRTVLGDHLLARTDSGWQHLDPSSRQPRPRLSEAEIRLLLQDAFATNPARYGNILSVAGETAQTDTGVEITIDSTNLSFQQKGKDTQRIDRLYKIHYLQWTGVKNVDRVLGFLGLALVMTLSILGAWLAVKR